MAPDSPTPEEDVQVPDSEEEDVQIPDSEEYSPVPDSSKEVVEASEEARKESSEEEEASAEESSEEEEASAEESSEEEEDPTVKPTPTIPGKRPAKSNLAGKEAKRVKEEAQPNRNDDGERNNVESLVKKEGMESEREKIERELKIEQLELIMRFAQLKKDIANLRQKALRFSIPCSDDEGSSSRMEDEWSLSRMRCEWHSLWCDWRRL
ncbi:microfibrillar-associated protein 1-like [Vitis riparia]|uniref:microfibrillar-associated protein 1-like n=1 Tax=Vitis riparia TaxID=96939 RepID=UPI00155A38F5|nr:microfibrillar-associated protein 1-like [Vitis riparia]XP_034674036.1 microfibrillar-associated protein 1-like [Vitis riparia]